MSKNEDKQEEITDLEVTIRAIYKELTGREARPGDSAVTVLKQSLAFLRNIIDQMPGLVYWQDKKNIFLGCNSQVAKNGGLRSSADIIRKTNYDMPWREQADALNALNDEVMKTCRVHKAEEFVYTVDHPEGLIYLSEKKPLVNEDGEVIGMLGVSLDITDKKNLENQLKAANELKTQFIQNMQHDLRTPTSGCMGMLQHLAAQETDPEKKNDLVLLYKAAKNIYEICDEIIDFEQLTHQHNPVLAKKFNLRELVQNVIELNTPAAKVRKLELGYEISSDVPHVIVGDPKRLSRLLINLVGNAVKFTEVGFVKIEVDAIDLTDKKNIVLEFKVSDSGIGIPADKKNLIYEKFTRLNPSNQGYYAGSGLGLNIVKRYVEDLKGEIEVESELKKGTIFHVTLPFEIPLSNRVYDKVSSLQEEIEDVKFPDEKIISKDVVSAPTKEGQLNILFIEDQKLAMVATLMTVANVVSSNNAKAENVAEAMKLLREKRFDLVISDLGLPDGDGTDIVRAIKSDPTELNYKTPFFALTAHNDLDKKTQTEAAGL